MRRDSASEWRVTSTMPRPRFCIRDAILLCGLGRGWGFPVAARSLCPDFDISDSGQSRGRRQTTALIIRLPQRVGFGVVVVVGGGVGGVAGSLRASGAASMRGGAEFQEDDAARPWRSAPSMEVRTGGCSAADSEVATDGPIRPRNIGSLVDRPNTANGSAHHQAGRWRPPRRWQVGRRTYSPAVSIRGVMYLAIRT